MRHENKFVFPAVSLGEIHNKLLSSKYFFKEIYAERRINNIYLDTMDFKNLFDNLHGVQHRVKHRIRWYGEEKGVKKPSLEYKIKQGDMGYKEYYALPQFTFDTSFEFSKYLDNIGKYSKSRTSQYKIMYRDIFNEIPTIYNTYLRCYFLSGNGNYRVTIDRELTYKSINRWFNDLSGFSEDKIVVELKYVNADIKGAGAIMQDLGLRLTRNSKYVIGMQALYFNFF